MPASTAPAGNAASPDPSRDSTTAVGDTPLGGDESVRRAALRSAGDGACPSCSLNSFSVASTCAAR